MTKVSLIDGHMETCGYCDNNGELDLLKDNRLDVYVIDSEIRVSYDDRHEHYSANFRINFCPMCGRELKE